MREQEVIVVLGRSKPSVHLALLGPLRLQIREGQGVRAAVTCHTQPASSSQVSLSPLLYPLPVPSYPEQGRLLSS